MSRSTQWVGLTTLGTMFVLDLERLPSDNHTDGMFDETLPLGKWKAPEGRWHKAMFVREVVQEVPWSSGPMIFTHLEIEYHHDSGQTFTARASSGCMTQRSRLSLTMILVFFGYNSRISSKTLDKRVELVYTLYRGSKIDGYRMISNHPENAVFHHLSSFSNQ